MSVLHELTVPSDGVCYSPAISRGGDRAILAFQVVDIGSSGDLTIALEHKNSEDVAYGSVGASATSSTAEVVAFQNSNSQLFKEMIRAKYTNGSGADVVLEMLTPSWFDDQ